MFGFIAIALKNPLVRKALPYILVGVAALWAVRVWTNGIAERAAAQAKIKEVETQLETERKEWKGKEEALRIQQAALDKAFSDLDAQRTTLGRSRLTIKGELEAGIGNLTSELSRRQSDIARVPGSELDQVLKRQLVALR